MYEIFESIYEEAKCLMAAVEQFNSWSACKINKISKALEILGCGL